MGFVHIDHVGIVAYTIEQAQEILGEALGLELDEPRSQWPNGSYFPPEQTYNYFFQVGEGETQVEVLIPEAGPPRGGPLPGEAWTGHAPPLLRLCRRARRGRAVAGQRPAGDRHPPHRTAGATSPSSTPAAPAAS